MNVTDIITEYGAYYIEGGQNLSRLYQLLNFTSQTETYATPIVTNDTLYRVAGSSLASILQPFQKQWTPAGALEFKPNPIELFNLKADLEEYPDELEATWLGFLAGNSLDRREWPFVRWFVEQKIIPQIKDDYESQLIYKGIFAAPTPGTPGPVNTAMNGIKKVQDDFVTAGRITPIVSGAPNTDPKLWLAQVEDFAGAIDERYWAQQMTVLMSPQLFRRYQFGYLEKYGQNSNFAGNVSTIANSNLMVAGVPSMIGSNRIWATPKSNFLHLMKKENSSLVRIENVDRLVKVYTDFYKGVGFAVPEAVFITDQA